MSRQLRVMVMYHYKMWYLAALVVSCPVWLDSCIAYKHFRNSIYILYNWKRICKVWLSGALFDCVPIVPISTWEIASTVCTSAGVCRRDMEERPLRVFEGTVKEFTSKYWGKRWKISVSNPLPVWNSNCVRPELKQDAYRFAVCEVGEWVRKWSVRLRVCVKCN